MRLPFFLPKTHAQPPDFNVTNITRQSEVRSGGLLLRHAGERAQSQHEILAADADHFPVRE